MSQAADRNREDLQSLAETVVLFITLLRKVATGRDESDAEYASEIMQDCNEFTEWVFLFFTKTPSTQSPILGYCWTFIVASMTFSETTVA